MTKLNLRRPATISADKHNDDQPPSPPTGTPVIVLNHKNRQRRHLRRPSPSQFCTEGMTKKDSQEQVKKKTKRGIASFSKKIPEDKRHISFDENNVPFGDLLTRLRSWYGMMVQHNFPVHIQMHQFEDKYFDALWLETKKYWKIQTEAPKEYMKKWATRLGTNFRSKLVREYVNRGLDACDKFPFIDPDHWEVFVKQKTSDEFKAKSAKAKASNAKRKHVPRVGRSGWSGLKLKQGYIWSQLESRNKEFKSLGNPRSKLYLCGRAKINEETKLYELDDASIEELEEEKKMKADGSYYQNKDDPLVRVLGPEHGGRARTVSGIIGYIKVNGGLFRNVNPDRQVDYPPTLCGSSYGCDGRVDYPAIKSHTKCELLINVADKLVKVANGQAWPTTSTGIHCSPIKEGCVKVTVDDVVDEHKKLDLYSVTRTSEVAFVEDLVHQIVQWPRYAIRLLNQGTPTKSPSALGVHSSHGSRSRRGTSPIIHGDDTAITSSYIPQLVDEDDDQLPLQLENQELFEGGFVNMLLSMGQQQTATNTPVRVPDPEPEPEPVPKLIPKPKPKPVPVSLPELIPEPQITIINGSEYDTWDDLSLEPALDKVRNTTGLIRDMFDKLHRVVGTRRHICTSSPQGMYPRPVTNLIPYSEL